jgi:hypothetical protein
MIVDTTGLFGLDYDIWDALSGTRVAQWRVDKVAESLRSMRRETDRLRTMARHEAQEARDLRIHLRDRDAHIRNLEAQLRPHLLAQSETVQEALA